MTSRVDVASRPAFQWDRMLRCIAILTLVAFLAPTTGVAVMLGRDSCADECASESAGERDDRPCDMQCSACPCCPGLRSIVFAPIDVAAPDAPAAALVPADIDTHSAPDPRDILHVPKLA
jgi:hypothetical protein